MTQPGKEIMAVQALRNFIMVSIMMASTASLFIMGTLTGLFDADPDAQVQVSASRPVRCLWKVMLKLGH